MLSKEEKDLLNQLQTINPDNIWKLVEEKFNFQLSKYEGNHYSTPTVVLHPHTDVYKISMDEEKLVFSYVAFIENFLKKMKNNGYLNVDETSNHDVFNTFIYKGNATNIIANKMNDLMKKYKNQKVTLNDTLDQFIKNNYKTDSEIESNLTRKIAIVSLIISIFAIIVPTVTTIYTTWYENKNDSNERIVTLKTNEIEKLPIEIINKLELDKDSIGTIPINVEITVKHEYPKKDEKK